MQDRITLDELEKRIRAGDLKKSEIGHYFRTNENLSQRPFFPGLEPHPDTVLIPPPGAITPLRAHFPFIVKLWIKQQRLARDTEYKNYVQRVGRPIIVTRGDSWFLHPKLLDVIDHMRGAYAFHSYDYPGDTLDDILADTNHWKVAIRNADIFMLSGGGNDVIGGGAIANHLFNFDSNINDPTNYLKPSYHVLVNKCLMKIEKIFDIIIEQSNNVRIMCHGYDYVTPNGQKWLGGPMNKLKIKNQELQRKILRIMIDNFNKKLHQLARSRASRVHYLDLRGVVTHSWDDELHPSAAGFSQVASRFLGVI